MTSNEKRLLTIFLSLFVLITLYMAFSYLESKRNNLAGEVKGLQEQLEVYSYHSEDLMFLQKAVPLLQSKLQEPEENRISEEDSDSLNDSAGFIRQLAKQYHLAIIRYQPIKDNTIIEMSLEGNPYQALLFLKEIEMKQISIPFLSIRALKNTGKISFQMRIQP